MYCVDGRATAPGKREEYRFKRRARRIKLMGKKSVPEAVKLLRTNPQPSGRTRHRDSILRRQEPRKQQT